MISFVHCLCNENLNLQTEWQAVWLYICYSSAVADYKKFTLLFKPQDIFVFDITMHKLHNWSQIELAWLFW